MTNTQDDSAKLRKFQPIGQFNRPPMPTDESLRRAGWKLWRHLRGNPKSDPFIADESLSLANKNQLDKLAAPPACGPLLDELTSTFADWLATPEPAHWVQLVVLPPCDHNDVLRSWAMANKHFIVEPPERTSLLCSKPSKIELDGSQDLLVLPRMEHWFLRHHLGLNQLQQLLNQLVDIKQHCIVGCNSWAWSYLSKAIQTQLVLPRPLMFEAFDRDRLKSWLTDLSTSDDHSNTFRFAKSGTEIFGEQAKPRAADDYFATLAARSLGIPWVAWHQWRRSLKLSSEADDKFKERFPHERTVWVAEVGDFSIPSDDMQAGLLILQSLLIHDRLTAVELAATVPGVQCSNVLSALLDAEIVYRDGHELRCVPAAYPAVRASLLAAGFPGDPL